ncbi:MAG: NADP(H)-dependent aldo-keto reductase [Rhodospirillales bacterium]
MEQRPLGRSGERVSALCLGTMTWGEQNSEAEGHAQMDLALERGVTFWDTAEMYSAPTSAATYGRTEEIIGSWFASRGGRDRVFLASKVLGPGESYAYARGGKTRHNAFHLTAALEESLRRLRTDRIDLYQLHWPDRSTNFFGKLGFVPDPEEAMTPPEETLRALEDLVASGKVRHVGLSNETAWGAMRFLSLAEQGLGPRVVSIQNAYNLLNRSFEVGLAEVAWRENCGLLAYAPAAAGALSGKYLDGARPPGARMTLFPKNSRYLTTEGHLAVAAYVDLARQNGLDPVQMATAFVLSRPFTTAAIVGATTLAQLETQLGAAEITLSQEVLDGIEAIHRTYTYPCP